MGNQDLSLVHLGLYRRALNAEHLISGTTSITLFFYYCALHFDEEVEYIWSRPWTRGKVIYIVSRYTGAIFLILMGIGLLPIRWNDAGHPLINGKKLEMLEIGACLGGYLYVVAGTVTIVLAEITLAMRIYALYGRRKWMAVICAILILISCAGTQGLGIIYILKPEDSCIGKPCLFDSSLSYQITITCAMASDTISVFGWIPTSVVELIFLVLVLWKTRKMQKIHGEYSLVAEGKTPYAVDIMAVMARDSKKYFLQMFVLCFIGACLNVIVILDNFKLHSSSLAITLPAVLSNTFVTFAVAVLSILAPELFISLRMEYYGPVGSLADKSQLSWEVAIPEGSQHAPQESGSERRGQYSIVEDQEA
ncbi:hypothetical protein ACEPAI_2344 [Sanghuangporus weigelae]